MKILPIVVVGILNAGLLLLTPTAIHAAPEQPVTVGRHERLLVLAPHPDDEALSSAGLIKRVLQNDGTARVVVVTSGDAYVDAVMQETGKRKPTATDYLSYGEKRLEESRKVAQYLGQGQIRLDLLGFSDGSIYTTLVSHWRKTNPARSEYTGFDHVPYQQAEDWGLAQDGKDLHDRLLAILRETNPTMVTFPDVMESDSDHAGLGMFALLVIHDWLTQSHGAPSHPRLLAYLIHWLRGWPQGADARVPQDQSNRPMHLPDDLPLRGEQRLCLELDGGEVAAKGNAMALYQTQQRAMGSFLSAFIRSSECFSAVKLDREASIGRVIEHWRQARKAFDYHPLTRSKI
jgi:LmbE family N-acetylglucosaminyl deacetylase